MTDRSDWNVILDYTDAVFYRLAFGIACGVDISLEDAHEKAWLLFERGRFRLVGTADNVDMPCHSRDDRRAAIQQNKPLADYRRRVIEEAVAAA
jgi:hypothetical protein